jgi:hypothetical protein
MKEAVIKLEVSVRVRVPEHVYERDRMNEDLSETDVWHDYAVGAVTSDLQTLHGLDEERDWVELYAEVETAEIEEGPVDV